MLEISINRLRLEVFLGAYEEERRASQVVFADIALKAEADAACRSDRLADTVDYGALARRIVAATGGGRVFQLVESLADAIAETCLAADPRVASVFVAVEKPSALPGLAASASVKVERTRD